MDSAYEYLQHSGKPVQVDSALRDEVGRRIETKYLRTVNNLSPVSGNVDIPLSDYCLSSELEKDFLHQEDFTVLSSAFIRLESSAVELIEED